MRELKFRVWDKMEKRFIYPDKGYQGHYVLTLGGEFYNLQNGSGGSEYIVQQCTGLKDVNNKEIWEWDIVKTADELIGVVRFDNGRFYHTAISQYTGSPYWGEVIGNIFENPELL
jgi:hypothetical protein